jgi:hypothetical protein
VPCGGAGRARRQGAARGEGWGDGWGVGGAGPLALGAGCCDVVWRAPSGCGCAQGVPDRPCTDQLPPACAEPPLPPRLTTRPPTPPLVPQGELAVAERLRADDPRSSTSAALCIKRNVRNVADKDKVGRPLGGGGCGGAAGTAPPTSQPRLPRHRHEGAGQEVAKRSPPLCLPSFPPFPPTHPRGVGDRVAWGPGRQAGSSAPPAERRPRAPLSPQVPANFRTQLGLQRARLRLRELADAGGAPGGATLRFIDVYKFCWDRYRQVGGRAGQGWAGRGRRWRACADRVRCPPCALPSAITPLHSTPQQLLHCPRLACSPPPGAQHSTAQHSTAQHSTAQHSTAQPPPAPPPAPPPDAQGHVCAADAVLGPGQPGLVHRRQRGDRALPRARRARVGGRRHHQPAGAPRRVRACVCTCVRLCVRVGGWVGGWGAGRAGLRPAPHWPPLAPLASSPHRADVRCSPVTLSLV